MLRGRGRTGSEGSRELGSGAPGWSDGLQREGSNKMMRWVFSMAVVVTASVLCAQPDPRLPDIPVQVASVRLDSGVRTPKAPGQVLARFDVSQPGAAWMRLYFGECRFSASRAEGGSYLRLTGRQDGAVQILDADGFAQWGGTSAYFNGSVVTVELVAGVDQHPSRVSVDSVNFEALGGVSSRSICGPTDDRQASAEAANARLLPAG